MMINTNQTGNTIKMVLAILFFVCLLKMPYGFYQLVRLAGLIGFSILAYQANLSGNQIAVIVYLGLAILFQPLFKIPLGRQVWNVVDVIVGFGLIITIFLNKKNKGIN